MKGGLLFLILLLIVPGPLLAQEPLDEVETLMGQGRILQAREVLQDWLEGDGLRASRTEQQRSIWLRGRLTVDPSMAEMDFRRLVVEFPGGPFTDDALFRLAQGADFRGDLREANTQYTSLLRDYPSSPYRNRAEGWVRSNADAVEALGPEEPAAADPGPLLAARPVRPAVTESVGTTGRETDGSPILTNQVGSEGGGGSFSVQVGAFRRFDGAQSLAERLRAAGYAPRVVRTARSDLVRVRVGRFPSREAVSALKKELEDAGFEAAIVSDADAEEVVG